MKAFLSTFAHAVVGFAVAAASGALAHPVHPWQIVVFPAIGSALTSIMSLWTKPPKTL